ncbi:MAG: response regulator transcription factor [Planctomycetes bacterium]|nr:response regulator transcription factor [Planctomycetota bacterium]
MNILVVEDDPKVSRSLCKGFEEEGYQAEPVLRGDDAIERIEARTYDLVLLDLNLPGKDGVEILRAVRRFGRRLPVLVLTARDSIDQRVEGLDAGADDYLVKPFAFAELLARVRALLRRGRTEETLVLKMEHLELDLVTRTLTQDGEAIDLTPRELKVIEILMRHPRKAVSREVLAREVWDQDRNSAVDNLMEVVLGRLRKKIGHEDRRFIHTVRGVGYKIDDADG